ncbi:MAG: hypothetical protein R2684_14705 [Pyrinomonadaceae bacterium]
MRNVCSEYQLRVLLRISDAMRQILLFDFPRMDDDRIRLSLNAI